MKPRLSGDCSGNHISEGLNFPSFSGKYASQSLKRACKQAQYSTLPILHLNECWYWPTQYQICQGVTFTFPHISMISSTHQGMKKVCKHTTLTLSLPAVIKTEFLLTISIQSQVDKWWVNRKISISGLSFDSIPNSRN